MTKILGIDLGTNSIGLSVRDDENGNNIVEQLDYYKSVIFESGVGRNKSGEYSYAADRTKHRSTRRLYQARKYRKWSTLALLIENGYCPLSLEDLDRWRMYDKGKRLHREYPINATQFIQWIRLDFNGDGVADYSSPYQLRAELMEHQFDFSDETERFKLGRAIYHIAQRRGFKSSKGETIAEQEAAETFDSDTIDMASELKKSEEKKAKDLVAYMEENNLPTVGCAFAHLERHGIRVRNSIYQAVRSQYKDELIQIFRYQNGIDENCDFCKRVLSEKKHEGTVFYKRPLRSQKGTVGKCTFEPDKPRCQTTHPDFEEFRAWCFINNIKYRSSAQDDWRNIDLELKQAMFNEKFIRVKTCFKFKELHDWLEEKLSVKLSKDENTINYSDNTNVPGCPISARLKNLLGENWRSFHCITNQARVNPNTNEPHIVSYDIYDIWHICATASEAEDVEQIARERLGFNDKQVSKMVSLWGNMRPSYAQLSLKAIRKINYFLRLGLIYSDSVLLAKVPEIIGEDIWEKNKSLILSSIAELSETNNEERTIYKIANDLIAQYKILDLEYKFGNHDTSYKLDEDDKRQVKEQIVNTFTIKSWNAMGEAKQRIIEQRVIKLYQDFFASPERAYYKIPKIGDTLKQFLYKHFDSLQCDYDNPSSQCKCSACRNINKLYHPSQLGLYKPVKYQYVDCKSGKLSKKLLGKPNIGSIKNPVVMRSLYTLRNQINGLIKEEIIDEDTRVVIETARDLNDANMRWSIEQYQKEREKENKEIEKIILEYYPTRGITDNDIDKVRLLLEQHDIAEISEIVEEKGTKEEKTKFEHFAKDITKYKLWLEQGCRCIYTGNIINISRLFDDNFVDFEHTIPRSISFDNSLANLTICDAKFNRSVKKNQIPSQLHNYSEILLRIKPWEAKIKKLNDSVSFWSNKAKQAIDKSQKDFAIRQRHLWQMELSYWKQKVRTFTIQPDELGLDFCNSQLVDTRIITKYAFHYLKTVFERVDVQKGSTTAEFRKILGIQSINQKKTRTKHSHHAIDATILTMIPVAAKRDKMLKLFYEIQEAERYHIDCSKQRGELEHEITTCHIGDVKHVVDFIESNILINHITHDQSLTPAKRQLRRRGKPVLNKDGKPIWLTGDSIRGKLHGDTYYGAITQGKKDINGRLQRTENGKIIINEPLYFVVRRELKFKKNAQDSGFTDWDDLEKSIVDKALFGIIKGQFPKGTSLKDACDQGIYMYDRKGGKVNKIRHIRCFTSVKNPLSIKTQTHHSDKPYKQHIYAEVGDLYVMCKYQSDDLISVEYVIYSLFDVSQNRKLGLDDIPTSIKKINSDKALFLKQIIRNGDLLLLFDKSIDELKGIDATMLSKRLFKVKGFENDGMRIILQRHLNAQPDKELGKGESIKTFDNLPEKIRCGVRKLNFVMYNNYIKEH